MYDSFSGLALLKNARSRAITAENRDGAKGGGARSVDGHGAAAARDLGRGWKVSPAVPFAAGETLTQYRPPH